MRQKDFFNYINQWKAKKIIVTMVMAIIFASILFGLPKFIFNTDDTMDRISKQGVIRVLTRNTPTTYFELHDEGSGLEYDLASAFANDLGVKIEIIVKQNIPDLLAALKNGEGDLVAAGITRTEARENEYKFGPDYLSIQQQVVCNNKFKKIESPEQLTGTKLSVIKGSSYEETLNDWKLEYQELEWIPSDYLTTDQLLDTVAKGKLDCTMADSNIVAVNRRYYSNLNIVFAASEQQQLAWVIPQNAGRLESRLSHWFEKSESNNLIASIRERYYGYIDIYDHVDLKTFRQRIKTRLPKFRKLFEKASAKYNFPWTLLAAQSYQESHWNAKAKSPTGVRGLMMLTLNTAKSLGVKSRLDPKQSVNGGAKYLHKMMKRLPEEINNENRLYLALAAYNIGMGHLQDARKLAPSLGKNPDLWIDLKEVLPLLSEKAFYTDLKHGYARGQEPVNYVTRIRNYEDILKQSLKAKAGRVMKK